MSLWDGCLLNQEEPEDLLGSIGDSNWENLSPLDADLLSDKVFPFPHSPFVHLYNDRGALYELKE